MFRKILFLILVPFYKYLRSKSHRDKSLFDDISKVAVVCTGGVGDILMCTPAIRSIKETFPSCELTALIHQRKIALLEFNSNIDKILPIKKRFSFYLSIYNFFMGKRKPEVVFFFHTNEPLMYCLMYLICPRGLIGFSSDSPFDFLLERKFDFESESHVILNNLKIVSVIGAFTDDKRMNLYLSGDDRIISRKYLGSCGKNRPIIGFQLGSAVMGRCWPIPKYAELGIRLFKELDAKIVLLGSSKEKSLVELLNRSLSNLAVPAIVDLSVAGEIIRSIDVLVTPNTGPMHMAFALNCPSVVLSGPTNPKNFGPLETEVKHCYLHKPPDEKNYVKLSGDHTFLLDKIDSGDVYDAIILLLKEPRTKFKQEY